MKITNKSSQKVETSSRKKQLNFVDNKLTAYGALAGAAILGNADLSDGAVVQTIDTPFKINSPFPYPGHTVTPIDLDLDGSPDVVLSKLEDAGFDRQGDGTNTFAAQIWPKFSTASYQVIDNSVAGGLKTDPRDLYALNLDQGDLLSAGGSYNPGQPFTKNQTGFRLPANLSPASGSSGSGSTSSYSPPPPLPSFNLNRADGVYLYRGTFADPDGPGTESEAWGNGKGEFIDQGYGFIGIRFDAGSTGQSHYGYLYTYHDRSAKEFWVLDGGWETSPETPITLQSDAVVPNIPEPSGMALLAMGAAGVCSMRRKCRDETNE